MRLGPEPHLRVSPLESKSTGSGRQCEYVAPYPPLRVWHRGNGAFRCHTSVAAQSMSKSISDCDASLPYHHKAGSRGQWGVSERETHADMQ